MSISAQDHARIAAAIRSAEAKTSGEIVCVLARTSSHATALPVLIAAAAALALPWLLVGLTAMTVHRILLLQVIVFLALLVLLCLPRVRVALMPRKARRAIAHRVAMEQFVSRGIARTKDRSGILIFVSLAERYARIIADEGIAHARRPHRRRFHHGNRSVRQQARGALPAHRSRQRGAAGPDLFDLRSAPRRYRQPNFPQCGRRHSWKMSCIVSTRLQWQNMSADIAL
jgi:putative membrane protein